MAGYRLLLATVLAAATLVPLVGARAQTVEEAESALRTGRYQEAIDLFSRLARREPTSIPAARGHARALYVVGRYRRAEEVAREFSRRVPGSAELSNLLGQALYAQGAIDQAETAFERSLAGPASDAVEARLNLAVLHYERGQVDRAMREFDAFIDIYNRGRSLSSPELTAVGTAVRHLARQDSRLYRDALRAYDEAIAADPSNLEPRVRAGELFLEKYNSADAAGELEDVLQVNPAHPRALLGKARQLRFDGAPGAMEMIERALETNPNYVEAHAFRA
ncbi:MAG: tetratricopeptide repeat protein, partial [Gemmatimonadetes bacterium]|nr:tetratricopeptide repeat protein [Gemmatimonadota bacterium]